MGIVNRITPMVTKLRSPLLALLLSASIMTVGCTSKDQKAAAAAQEAEAALQRGDMWNARRAIGRAVGIRDDVSDYWLLSGRIALTAGDLGGAFNAYQNVINLDRANVEALQMLCRLALIARDPDRVDRYADQLLLLTPGNPIPLTARGAAALQRGDTKAAGAFADQALASSPNYFDALMLKGRVALGERRYADAAQIVESTLSVAGSPAGRLDLLRDIYSQSSDRAGYERTIARLAQAQPDDPVAQLTYADQLFELGRGDDARGVVARAVRLRPDDNKVAGTLLETLRRQGPDAMPIAGLEAAAAELSPTMRAAYAQYAIDRGQPALAARLVAGAGDTPDVRAVRALADGLTGNADAATAALNEVLEAEPSNPAALLARARLLRDGGKLGPAIADARRVVTDDTDNVTARLFLADLFAAQNDGILAEGQLREGLEAVPGDARLSARLATTLTARGRVDAAADVWREGIRNAPLDLRTRRAHDAWCAEHKGACA